MYGWTGNILEIDAGSGATRVLHPPASAYRDFIGGRGLAGYYLAEHACLPYDDPAIPLLFFTGPLVDTASPTSGRMCIMSRSPLTGTVCDTSVGGRLGIALKRAGWDGIMITGRAASLCGISVQDQNIEIRDASGLARRNTDETLAALAPGSSSAVIGPAAENGVLFANICVDGHFFSGRGGLGLVMASKNLKYLSVAGTGKTAVNDPEELAKAREEIFRLAAASPILKGELGIGEYGTGALFDLMHSRRMMPTGNFRSTRFEDAPKINSWHYREFYKTKKAGCPGCHIQCKKMGSDGTVIPEFETMSHFSALLENSDTGIVVEANRLCNSLGMDTITAASTLAAFAELRGSRVPGPEILSLLADIAHSRGEGELLKLGSQRYAGLRGSAAASISVKGLELPAYDPRGAYGMALAYATSTRGGCHLRAYPISHEILRKPVATDRFTFGGKARIIKLGEDLNAAVDSLTACKFIFFAASLEEYSRAFTAVTGVKMSGQDLLRAGERTCYHERIMNARNGFSAADDDLPARFFHEEGTSGDGIVVRPLDRDQFLEARGRYYRVRGLGPDGMPTAEKARELGLSW